MKITSDQKVIKIGSSLAVTIPAKQAARAGIVVGSRVHSAIEPVEIPNEHKVLVEYEAFKSKYAETLKNLANK